MLSRIEISFLPQKTYPEAAQYIPNNETKKNSALNIMTARSCAIPKLFTGEKSAWRNIAKYVPCQSKYISLIYRTEASRY